MMCYYVFKPAVWQLNNKPILLGHIVLGGCMCESALAVPLLLCMRITHGVLSASFCESVHLQV